MAETSAPLVQSKPGGESSACAPPKRFWASNSVALRHSLSQAIDISEVKVLHRLNPLRHFMVFALLLLEAALLCLALLPGRNPLTWIPLSLLLGLVFFDFTVLLHEVVHRIVFIGRHEGLYFLLGWIYAIPSGLSRSQFIRWHLDHHAGLGSVEEDPKRHWLSPKRNARWFKLLYFTPALIPIYFRAAAKESARYEKRLRLRIRLERLIVIGLHAAAVAAIFVWLGAGALLRLYLVPYFFGFPLAFALNRLGQHYDVDPEDPARWGTRMKRSILWDWLFLFSSYHLEHHYFPGVPFYNLRKLNRSLEPFFKERGIPARSYSWLLWQWLGRNQKPHAKWE
jgi:fatty acid desaturase